MRPLRILIWHLHGTYLHYLTVRSPHQFYVPFKPDRADDYIGRWGHLPWGANVHDVPADQVKNLDLDCIVYQSGSHFFVERFAILSPAQRSLPAVYLEHDPPRGHPTDTRHPVDDPSVLMVHVTPFNQLMWDTRRTPSVVIEHGVLVPEGILYTGEYARGIVVVNHLRRRGRRLGADLYDSLCATVPLDCVGMDSQAVTGGLGEVTHRDLPAFMARYRFFFHPIRYTSLGLAVCEAMMLGMPVVAPATAEMATVIKNGVSGYVNTDVYELARAMHRLIDDPSLAKRLGEGARRYAKERFNIDRFTDDWNEALALVTGTAAARRGTKLAVEDEQHETKDRHYQ